MCPGWWAGRGCLLGVLLLLLLLLPAGGAPSTTPGAPGAPPDPPRAQHHRRHLHGGVPRVLRARRPPPRPRPSSDSGSSRLSLQVQELPPLVAGPTGPPGITASDPSMMVRSTRSAQPSNNTGVFVQHHKFRHQLYSENAGRVMKLLTDGTVLFTDNLTDPYTLLYVQPIGNQGVEVIRSEPTGLYLCMDKRGRLYASCNRSSECEFVSRMQRTFYDTVQSHRYIGRFLAISASGRIKRARRVEGPLKEEHFFIFRKITLRKARHIIEQYQAALVGQPPQRCAGYNKYTASHDRGRGKTTVVTMAPSTTVEVPPTVVTLTLPSTTTPAPTTATATTTKRRRCQVVRGKKRCKRCRIVKGRKKCRKRRKRCKNKKCRERRKRMKDRRNKVRGKDNQKATTAESGESATRTTTEGSTSPSPVSSVGRRRSKVVGSKSTGSRRHRHRHRPGSHHNRYQSVRGGSQARRPRHHHTSTSSTLSPPPTTTPIPLYTRPREPLSGPRPWPVTSRPPRPRPFPQAPSPARPYRVRHGHNTRRRGQPRGPYAPPTSRDA